MRESGACACWIASCSERAAQQVGEEDEEDEEDEGEEDEDEKDE